MWRKRKEEPERIGKPRASGSGYSKEQLDLATFITGEEVRILSLPTLEPFRVLDMEPTATIFTIRLQFGARLDLIHESIIREIGLHRHPGNWLLKAKWLRERIKEAWERLWQLHQDYELQDYAIARGAPDHTVHKPVPPPLPRETRSTTPTTGKGKLTNLPN